MKTRLINWARTLPLQRLLWTSAASAWILDILSSMYFVRYWYVKNTGERMWSMAMALQGQDWYALDPEYRQQLTSVVAMSAGLMLLGLVLVNTVFYLYLGFRKRWSWQYVLTYTLSAAAMGLMTLFEGVRIGAFWDLFNILSIPAYLFLGFVVWARKSECADKGFRFKSAQNPE
jgi:hypothetical protein